MRHDVAGIVGVVLLNRRTSKSRHAVPGDGSRCSPVALSTLSTAATTASALALAPQTCVSVGVEDRRGGSMR